MLQLIQFRQLTSELNKPELKQLFSTLIENEPFNEEFIITSILNQMHTDIAVIMAHTGILFDGVHYYCIPSVFLNVYTM